MIAPLRYLVLSASVAVLSLSGCNRTPPTAAPAPAQTAAEEAKSLGEATSKLAGIAWADYVDLASSDDPEAIAGARREFMESGEAGFEYLLKRLPLPTVEPAEQKLGLAVLEEMAQDVPTSEQRTSAIGVLLDLRDQAATDELRDSVTRHLLVMLDLAIEADPKNADLFYFRGDERLTRKEHDQAIEDFTKAVALRPDFANALYLRGLAQRAKGNDAEAIVDYTAALGVNPDYPDVLVARAASYVKLSEPEKAIADLTAAIERKPEWAHAYQLRAQAYEALGDTAKATADQETADRLRAAKQ